MRLARNSAPDGSGTWTATDIAASGVWPSLSVVAGNPAISYYDAAGHFIKFARNSAPDGSGTWTTTTVIAPGNLISDTTSMVIASGNPAIAYHNNTAAQLQYMRNSAADGSGTWGLKTVDTTSGSFPAMAIVAGNPAIVHYGSVTGIGYLKFARSNNSDGVTGTWATTTVVAQNSASSLALGVFDGKPVIAFTDSATGNLKLARNSAADGSGTWTITTIDTTGGKPSLGTVNGDPAVVYTSSGGLKLARNNAPDGSGTWTATTVDVAAGADYPSLDNLANGIPTVSYVLSPNLRWATIAYPAEIVVEQPPGSNLPDNGSRVLTSAVNRNTLTTFTVKNVGNVDLTGLGITVDGPDASDFTLAVPPVPPVSGYTGSTTFVIQFAPTAVGTKSAALHIASNDSDENPFDINLTGQSLSFTADSDGDGLNDAAEFLLSSLGFDWQVSQSSLVNAYYTNANAAGLYTTSQVQALNINVPLIQKDQSTGQFKLTLGLQKSANLTNYNPFPIIQGQTIFNNGQVEFSFSVPDNAAFFRLEAH